MPDAHLTLPSPNDFGHAQDQFMELYGSTAVMNTYLKLALLASCLVSIGVLTGC